MRAFWLAVAVAMQAGCSEAPAEDGPVATTPPEVTDPRDFSYLGNGTPGEHVHNYWGGRDSLIILEQEGTSRVAQSQGHALAGEFRPEEGSIIPQGAGTIEVTADWTLHESDSPLGGATKSDFDGAEIWVKTANDSEAQRVGPIEKGGNLRFNSTNEQADPPHYVLSLWRFQVVVTKADGSTTTFNGNAKMAVTAFRTLPLPVFPPHPDRWNGSTELLLSDAEHSVGYHVATPVFIQCANGCLPVVVPDAGLVIPHDTSEVVVTAIPSQTSSPIPIGLRYHGATTYTFMEVAPDSQLPGAQTYRIPVDGSGDSPYATQSLWEFAFHFGTPEESRESGVWTGQLHVTIKAIR